MEFIIGHEGHGKAICGEWCGKVGFDGVLIGVHGDLVRVIFFLTLSFLIFDFVSLSLSLSLSLLSPTLFLSVLAVEHIH